MKPRTYRSKRSAYYALDLRQFTWWQDRADFTGHKTKLNAEAPHYPALNCLALFAGAHELETWASESGCTVDWENMQVVWGKNEK